jgi:DnaJ-class molecular chaperone
MAEKLKRSLRRTPKIPGLPLVEYFAADCPDCKGSGCLLPDLRRCPRCDGAGQRLHRRGENDHARCT